MKALKSLLTVSALLLTSVSAFAAGVPLCWKDQQPGRKIVDGQFQLRIPTANVSGRDLAEVFALLNRNGGVGEVKYVGQQLLGVADPLADLYIVVQTLETLGDPQTNVVEQEARTEAVQAFTAVLSKVPGSTLECVKAIQANPHPGGTVSN